MRTHTYTHTHTHTTYGPRITVQKKQKNKYTKSTRKGKIVRDEITYNGVEVSTQSTIFIPDVVVCRLNANCLITKSILSQGLVNPKFSTYLGKNKMIIVTSLHLSDVNTCTIRYLTVNATINKYNYKCSLLKVLTLSIQ